MSLARTLLNGRGKQINEDNEDNGDEADGQHRGGLGSSGDVRSRLGDDNSHGANSQDQHGDRSSPEADRHQPDGPDIDNEAELRHGQEGGAENHRRSQLDSNDIQNRNHSPLAAYNAPSPTYAEIARYGRQEGIEWLERIGYLPEYADIPVVRAGILENALCGQVLMALGVDKSWLQSFLPAAPAAELSDIIISVRNNHSELEPNQV
jgi:hypothetical protein